MSFQYIVFQQRQENTPLPFIEPKCIFAKKFVNVLKSLPNDAVFIDLFGKSGLLSHIAKSHSQKSFTMIMTTITHLENMPTTNQLLSNICAIVGGKIPHHKLILANMKKRTFQRIEQEKNYQTSFN